MTNPWLIRNTNGFTFGAGRFIQIDRFPGLIIGIKVWRIRCCLSRFATGGTMFGRISRIMAEIQFLTPLDHPKWTPSRIGDESPGSH